MDRNARSNGILSTPSQEFDLFACLKALGILGLLEAVLGLTCLCTEIAGFTFRYELHRPYALEAAGILIALNTMFTGLWGFLTKLELVTARARHCMLLLGISFTLVSGAEIFAMLMLSLNCARSNYYAYHNSTRSVNDVTDLYEKRHEHDVSGIMLATKEEYFLLFVLRTMDAVLYFVLGFLFLATFLLICRNLRRIQKRGYGFFPNYRTAREGRTFFGKKKSVRFNENGERAVTDPDGSQWILATPSNQQE
ncbi:uncharacterized protein LOC129583240 isoform X2 [Paramacrobiotus metropolitanus]|nr:uncharacterized protein LOC129583240 isoform X2 [Paramacrobiotus metropolitanus]